MSDKTNYKRLWRQDREAGLFFRQQAIDSLKALNTLLNYIKTKFTVEEFKTILELIGAVEAPIPKKADSPATSKESQIITSTQEGK